MDKKMVVLALVLLGIAITGAAIGQIALKKGVDDLGGKYSVTDILKPWNVHKMFAQSPLIFVGLLIYAVGFFIWIAALSKLEVSFMYPMLSIAYVLVAVLAFVFLKEQITMFRWVGIALVTVGSVFLLKSL